MTDDTLLRRLMGDRFGSVEAVTEPFPEHTAKNLFDQIKHLQQELTQSSSQRAEAEGWASDEPEEEPTA